MTVSSQHEIYPIYPQGSVLIPHYNWSYAAQQSRGTKLAILESK